MAVALHYEDLGAGRPLMILHGLFGSARNWQGIARQLSTHYRLITVDLRNHGNSPHHPKMSYMDMAEDISALAERLEIGKLALLGHSMGGKAAMQLAINQPHRVDKLIILDIAPADYARSFAPLIDAMLAMPLHSIQNRGQAAQILARAIEDPGLRAFLLQNLVRQDAGYVWRLNLQALKDALPEIADFPQQDKQYHGQTLFLGGADSDYLLPRHHAAIHALFPCARIESIAHAGHWLHADQPRILIDRITQFIGS